MAATMNRAPFGELNPQRAMAVPGKGKGKARGGAPAAVARKATGPAAGVDATLAQLLQDTMSNTAATRTTSTKALGVEETKTGFCVRLVNIIAAPCAPKELPSKLAAAAYLKNFIKSRWDTTTTVRSDDEDSKEAVTTVMVPAASERPAVRDAILGALLSAEVSELRNMLAECFRMVAQKDFPGEWPSLVGRIASHIRGNSGRGDKENGPWALENGLLAAYMLSKCFKFFQNPSVAMEAAPEGLVDISKSIVAPIHASVFAPMTEALTSSGKCEDDENEDTPEFSVKLMRNMLKCFFCTTRSYMHADMETAPWLASAVQILTHAITQAEAAMADTETKGDDGDEDDEDIEENESDDAQWKLQKRAVQLLVNFQTRHRAMFKPFEAQALKLAQRAVAIPRRFLADRVRALFFNMLSAGVESVSGWRALAKDVQSILSTGVLPTLGLTKSDRNLWLDDEEEFIRGHVDDEEAGVSGFRDDIVTSRQCAVSFVKALAARESRKPAAAASSGGGRKKGRGRKRKKGKSAAAPTHLKDFLKALIAEISGSGAAPSSSKRRRSSGEGADPLDTESRHYALLMMFGASASFMSKDAGMMASFTQDLLIPACVETFTPDYMVSSTPFLQAASLWVLSRIAAFVPKRFVMPCFTTAMVLMGMQDREVDDEEVSWKPVRFTAAACLRELVSHNFSRDMLKPHLSELVDKLVTAAGGEDTACMPLLSLAVGKAEEDIIPFAGKLGKALVGRCIQEVDEGVDVTESLSMEAFVNIISALEDVGADEEEEEGDSKEAIDAAEVVTEVAALLPALLRAYWGEEADAVPFLPETMQLLSFLIKAAPEAATASGAGGAGAGAGAAAVAPAEIAGVIALLNTRLPGWWSEMSECDDCWDAVLEVAKFAMPDAALAAPTFRAIALMAAGMIKDACAVSHAGAFRFLMAVLSGSVATKDWMTADAASMIAAGMASYFSAGFEKGDMGQRAASLVLCSCVREFPTEVLKAAADADCVDYWLRSVAAGSAAATADEETGGVNQFFITGATALASASAVGAAGVDSSRSRRLVTDVMDAVAKQAIALEAALKEAAEASSDDEDEDEGSDEEEGDSEDGSDEEEEDSDAEEEEDSDVGKSDEEEEDSDAEMDEEAEAAADAEFYERYAEAARAADEDEEQLDPSEGFEELVEESSDFDAAAFFFAWWAENSSEPVFKRATSQLLKRHTKLEA